MINPEHARREHLPWVETGPSTARRPGPGEACQTCGQEIEYQEHGTVLFGIFELDLDTRELRAEGRRLPSQRVTGNWSEDPDEPLLVCIGPPPHAPEAFARFPLENGAWALLYLHHEAPTLTLLADGDTDVHVIYDADALTPIASPRCEGNAGRCDCMPYIHSVHRTHAGCVVEREIINADDILGTLDLWSRLTIPGLKEARERGQRALRRWRAGRA